jgi:3-oxoadipate enol-lactonase
MNRIKANGIEINYEISGNQNGPVVVLSHSLGSSLLMWEPQMPTLRAAYKVLRYDTRGHGKSEATAGAYTLEHLGDDAVRLLDGLGIEKVHWIGLSMGGMIGQSIALNHADRLQSLVLCDTGAIAPKDAQPLWQERIQRALDHGMGALVDETLERWFSPAFLKRNSLNVEMIRKEFLATPVNGYVGCTEAIRKLNYLDRLSEIRIPTLIMVGEDDAGTPVASSLAMHERIKDSKLVILPSARHLSNVEQPDAFYTALMEFLKGL